MFRRRARPKGAIVPVRALGPWRVELLQAAGLFVGFLLLALLSYFFAQPPFYPVWLPVGLVMAALLLSPLRRWPGFALAALLGNLIGGFVSGLLSLQLALSYSLIDTAGVLLGAGLLRFAIRGRAIDFLTVPQVWAYWALACGLGWGGALLLGAVLLSGFQVAWPALLHGWLAGVFGLLALGGTLLLWANRQTTGPHRRLRSREGAGLAVALAVTVAAFALGDPGDYAYLAFLAVFWAATRFGPLVAALVSLLLCAETLLLIGAGVVPFIERGEAGLGAGFPLQTFLVVLPAAAMLLAASAGERRASSAALRRSEERYRAFIANSSEGIWRIDITPPMPVTLPVAEQVEYLLGHSVSAEANSALARFHGRSDPQALIGRSLDELLPAGWHRRFMEKLVENGYRSELAPFPIRTADDQEKWLQGTAVGVVEDGQLVRFWGTVRDVSERMRHLALLQHQATHDALTGLPNRVHLVGRLDEEVRSGGHGALLIVDLKRFKEVNDTLGHDAGDELLRQLAQRLASLARERRVTVARLGGDDFAVLQPQVDAQAEVLELARALLELSRQAYPLRGLKVELGGSVGVALFPEHGRDGLSLLRRAEVALYQAKERGDGLVVYRPELDPYSPQRLAVITELGAAIRRSRLQLYFQPKIDLRSRRPAGVEALCRWPHPRYGLLPPSRFVPVAELSDLVGRFTRWVLDHALAQSARWRRAGLPSHCAVNLSVGSLLDEALPQTVADLLAAHQVEPHNLELEITETGVMSDPERALRVLGALRGLGVRLSVDDFGTGHSSLAYLKRLPIESLKIDRGFVQAMHESELDRIIVRSTIHLGHDLGLTVVAEGVDSGVTLERLDRLGCDQAQGFHIARPMPEPAATAWLRRHAA